MTTEIVSRDVDIEQFVVTTPTSLEVARKQGVSLSIDEWSQVGLALGQLGNSALWWIGDWFVLGEKTYGSTYSEAMAITGLAYATLANLASVARAVGSSRRRELLSFAHHAEVAALSPAEQERWLAEAEAEGLTRETLRSKIRGERELPRTPSVARIAFTAPPERAQIWQEAAADSGLEFDDWAAKVLDAASMLPQPDWAAGIAA